MTATPNAPPERHQLENQGPQDGHVAKKPRTAASAECGGRPAVEEASSADVASTRVASAQKLFVQLLSDKARAPTKGSAKAAGWDLYAAKTMTIPARDKAVVPTDISIHVPEGTYGRVAPRSGLAVKNFVDVGAGVVDEDYRGPLGVVLFNFGSEEFQINEGDRIAQLILEKICLAELDVVESLAETERGSGGFGSTGVSVANAVEAPTRSVPTAETSAA